MIKQNRTIKPKRFNRCGFRWCRWRDSNPHERGSPPPQDGVSASSTTSATCLLRSWHDRCINDYNSNPVGCQEKSNPEISPLWHPFLPLFFAGQGGTCTVAKGGAFYVTIWHWGSALERVFKSPWGMGQSVRLRVVSRLSFRREETSAKRLWERSSSSRLESLPRGSMEVN
jgi:hypothetical protein